MIRPTKEKTDVSCNIILRALRMNQVFISRSPSRIHMHAHVREIIIIIIHFLVARILPCSLLLSDFTHPYKINFHLLWFPYVNRYRAQWDNAPHRRETTQWVIKYSNYILQKKTCTLS